MESRRASSLGLVAALALSAGCAQIRSEPPIDRAEAVASAPSPVRPPGGDRREPDVPADRTDGRERREDSAVKAASLAVGEPSDVSTRAAVAAGQELTLEAAKELAYRVNPRLEQARASADAAGGNEEIAYSGFLPTFTGNYAYQAYSSAVGFVGIRDRFPVLPVRGFGPGTQDFHVTEMQLRWTIFQFGKQVARYDQAILREDIARLQLDRSRQTIEYDVSLAYFRVLETRSSLVSAEQAVVRAEAVLRDARDLERRGVITREDVLRVEVQAAEVRQLRTSASSAAEVAVAGLNRAIGWDINAPTRVAERRGEPRVTQSLEDCLGLAVENRREFGVVRRGIAVAEAGVTIAKADFLPSISIQSTASDVTGTGVQNSRVLAGGVFATMDLYAGGRRRGELRVADAEVRRAIAQAQDVCNAIAYEVRAAYLGIEDARERIRQARTALEQARENLRLIRNRYATGDVTLTDLIDAETTATRVAQNFSAAFYDYQSAVARLEYAVGAPVASPPTPAEEPRPEEMPPPATTPSPFAPTPRPSGDRGPEPFRLPPLMPLPTPSRTGAAPVPVPSVAPLTPDGAPPGTPSSTRPPSIARPPYEQQGSLGPTPPGGP